MYRYDYHLTFFNVSTGALEDKYRNLTKPGSKNQGPDRTIEEWLQTNGAFDGTLDEKTTAKLDNALPADLEKEDWDIILVDSPGCVLQVSGSGERCCTQAKHHRCLIWPRPRSPELSTALAAGCEHK